MRAIPPMDTNLKLGSSTALSRQNVENIGSVCDLQEGTKAEAAAPHERPGEGTPLHVRVPRPPRVVRRRRLHRPRHRRRLRGRRQRTGKKDMLGLTFSRNQNNLDELLLVNDILNHSTGRRRPLLVPWAFLGHFQRRGRGHHRERRRGGGRRRQRAKEVQVKEQGWSKT